MVSRFKAGLFLVNAVCVYMIALSVLWIFVTEIMFISDFFAFTGTSYADYLVSNPVFAQMYIITKKLIGVILLGLSLTGFLITKFAFEKKQLWSWYAHLLIAGFTWGTMILYKIFIGYLGGSMITFVIGASLHAFGLGLPAREFFKKGIKK